MTKNDLTYSSKGMFAKARAKVAAQEAKLAAMHRDDPQRKHEERVLRSMEQNASVMHLLLSLSQ